MLNVKNKDQSITILMKGSKSKGFLPSFFKVKPIYISKVWGDKSDPNHTGEIIKFEINSTQSNYITQELSLYDIYNDLNLRTKIFGKKYFDKDVFPFLIKYITAGENLSLQVHPPSKNEVWYFLTKEESKIILGLKENLKNDTLQNVMENINTFNVKHGDFAIVDSGTIHSIMENNIVCEIQDNADDTLRLYDWGRNRKLSEQEAFQVMNKSKIDLTKKFQSNFKTYKTSNFNIFKYVIDSKKTFKKQEECNVLIITRGNGKLYSDDCVLDLQEGDCIFLSAYLSYEIYGKMELLTIS